MKNKYRVTWEEKHSALVEAENAEQAMHKVRKCYSAGEVRGTIRGSEKAYIISNETVDSSAIDHIAIKWAIEDVKEVAPDLTDNECREVLQLAKDKHDANIGINWDVLEMWANEIREMR